MDVKEARAILDFPFIGSESFERVQARAFLDGYAQAEEAGKEKDAYIDRLHGHKFSHRCHAGMMATIEQQAEELAEERDRAGKLVTRCARLVEALEKIANEDYRGNRPNSSFEAEKALKEHNY